MPTFNMNNQEIKLEIQKRNFLKAIDEYYNFLNTKDYKNINNSIRRIHRIELSLNSVMQRYFFTDLTLRKLLKGYREKVKIQHFRSRKNKMDG